MFRALATAVAVTFPVLTLAEPPRVVTDIPPVHSLTARVMQGIGAPSQILAPGASPHGYAMRPSEAARLSEADLVIWMGPSLTPWLEQAINSLAPDAISVGLLAVEGTQLLGFREGVIFAEHDHAKDRESDAGNSDGHDHQRAHVGIDPHAWLDPRNAQVWLDAIAGTLARLDPDNSEAYRRNATEARAEIERLVAEIVAVISPVRGRRFIVFHDAYHYFERRFEIEASGAISFSDGSRPSAARVAAIRDSIRATGIRCVFAEPQFEPALIATVIEDMPVRAETLDPIGAELTTGPKLYPMLLMDLAAGLSACLG